jgi:hypothetical protein
MKWFKDVKNLNELRTLYRVLALLPEQHPVKQGLKLKVRLQRI